MRNKGIFWLILVVLSAGGLGYGCGGDKTVVPENDASETYQGNPTYCEKDDDCVFLVKDKVFIDTGGFSYCVCGCYNKDYEPKDKEGDEQCLCKNSCLVFHQECSCICVEHSCVKKMILKDVLDVSEVEEDIYQDDEQVKDVLEIKPEIYQDIPKEIYICKNIEVECGSNIGECKVGKQYKICVNGGWSPWSTCQGGVQAIDEICDGKDNDCDGQSDEDFNISNLCTKGIGECEKQGTYQCKEDGTGTYCDAILGTPSEEECNNLDDNCDDKTDEGGVCGCYQEGEGFMDFEGNLDCCPGLVKVFDCFPSEPIGAPDNCFCPTCPCYVCIKCGDGICGVEENWCNCLEDCPKPAEINCIEDIDCGKDFCGQGASKCLEIKYSCTNGKCSASQKEYVNKSCAKYYNPDLTYPDDAKCLDTCGDGICHTPETKWWCPEDC